MKFIFFLIFINLLYCLIPLWNFNNSSIELIISEPPKKIWIFENNISGFHHIKLYKEIWKPMENIFDQNYIDIQVSGQNYTRNIGWEDIESTYYLTDKRLFICTTGKNFLNLYKGGLEEKKPQNLFSYYDKDWELICYKFNNSNIIFQGFLNNKNCNATLLLDIWKTMIFIGKLIY